MTDETTQGGTDYAALAQRYLELWQDHIAKLAKDPNHISTLTSAWARMARPTSRWSTPPACA